MVIRILGNFYEKELQKTNQREFRIKKITKSKEEKLFVIWKGYDSSFKEYDSSVELIQKTLYKNESVLS